MNSDKLNHNIGVIIQARMTSTRLPGKVLLPVYQSESFRLTMLEAVINRIKNSKTINKIIVATTVNKSDDPIVELCQSLENIKIFRGDENNVLERYYLAAKENNLSTIIRITSDCPVIDPLIIDQLVNKYNNNNYDYVSNILERTYPRGLDAEVFSFEALKKANDSASSELEKEHTTIYIYSHPLEFNLGSYCQSEDRSEYRLTIDTEDDLRLIQNIYNELYNTKPNFDQEDIIKLLENNPEWLKINDHIPMKLCSSTYFKKE